MVRHFMAFAVLAVASGCGPTPRTTWKLKLTKISKPLAYSAKRTWWLPESGKNYKKMETSVFFNYEPPAKHNSPAAYRITGFRGISNDPRTQEHLLKIEPEVNKILFEELPPDQDRRIWLNISDTKSGWAGMMASKTIGMYGFGIGAVKMPSTEVAIGDVWTGSFDPLEEERSTNQIIQQPKPKSSVPSNRVDYRLESIEKTSSGQFARISFEIDSTGSYQYKEPMNPKLRTVQKTWVEKGFFLFDLKDEVIWVFRSRSAIAISDKRGSRKELIETSVVKR